MLSLELICSFLYSSAYCWSRCSGCQPSWGSVSEWYHCDVRCWGCSCSPPDNSLHPPTQASSSQGHDGTGSVCRLGRGSLECDGRSVLTCCYLILGVAVALGSDFNPNECMPFACQWCQWWRWHDCLPFCFLLPHFHSSSSSSSSSI